MKNTYVTDWKSFELTQNIILEMNSECRVILFCSGAHCPPCKTTKELLNIGKENDFFQKEFEKLSNKNVIFYCLDVQTQDIPFPAVKAKVRSIPYFFGLKIKKDKTCEILVEHVGVMNEQKAKEFLKELTK